MVKRIGLIIPSSNRMVEQEVVRNFPAGVVAHVARLRMTGRHKGPFGLLLPRVEEAAGALADAKCDVIMFHCTATSMEEGIAGEASIAMALQKGGETDQVATTASAIKGAFAALGARRVVVVTPYGQRQTDDEIQFLKASGLEVVGAIGHGLAGSDAYCSTPASFWLEATVHARHPDADAYQPFCPVAPWREARIPVQPFRARLRSNPCGLP
jgi:maleate isomerase